VTLGQALVEESMSKVPEEVGGGSKGGKERDSEKEDDHSWSLSTGSDRPRLITRSLEMRELIDLVKLIATRLAVALIEGETGTGKELIARGLHAHSSRHDGPFVAVNCGELADPLLESELCGHVKGAFTGAHSDKRGLVEVAHTGTLFLDEANEMSFPMQRNILRLLEEMEVRPVGATVAKKVDLAIIAASNEDLFDLVRRGRFRKDLYYRLKVAFLRIPPLRERLEDLRLLLQVFLAEYGRKYALPVPNITEELFSVLSHHPWTGNVRELKNSIGTFFTCVREGKFDVERIQAYLTPSPLTATATAPRGIPESEDKERRRTEEALRMLNRNKFAAALYLGIARSTLDRRIEKWGL
jgi:transcriptional regulator with PAS, ATPase and Fis domain